MSTALTNLPNGLAVAIVAFRHVRGEVARPAIYGEVHLERAGDPLPDQLGPAATRAAQLTRQLLAFARAFAMNWNFPALNLRPASFSACSVAPTAATSGAV